MSKLVKHYLIAAQPEAVWEALTNPKQITEWSGEPAEMTEKKGASFRLWGGYCFGRNIEVVRFRRLMQEWQEEGWKETSIVVFELKPIDGGTQLVFSQEKIPAERMQDLDRGWDESYIGPLKEFVESA